MKPDLPALPRLVFRVGFAGTQRLDPDTTKRLDEALGSVFEETITTLAGIKRGESAGGVARYYKEEKPLLRLITGLCEGADSAAFERFDSLFPEAPCPAECRVAPEFAAVVPFDFEVYRGTRPQEFLERESGLSFDDQAAKCAYILALDGICPPDRDAPLAKLRRARAYRAQSALLLRQCDLLVVAPAVEHAGKPGGSMETTRAAIEFGLPVVFIHLGSGKLTLLEPGDDFPTMSDRLSDGQEDWKTRMNQWILRLTADPDFDPAKEPRAAGVEVAPQRPDVSLLWEYFRDQNIPPLRQARDGKIARTMTLGERVWEAFHRRCKAKEKKPKDASPTSHAPPVDPVAQPAKAPNPYDLWRNRARELNYHYAGSYRGAFLLNYILAALAVALAALSLVILGLSAGHAHHGPADLAPLFVLGVFKLVIVIWIFRNTHRANHEEWNDKAVDFRYLAERLRAMAFLPRLGSFQPPAATPPQREALRAVRQSAVDWLADAIVRAVSPSEALGLKKSPAGDGKDLQAKIFNVMPGEQLAAIRQEWIETQADYHDDNARAMGRMHLFTESLSKACNFLVIGFVAFDILILLSISAAAPHGWLPAGFTGWLDGHLPGWHDRLHVFTPVLIFFAALLPAVVASVNGIRFQTECRRLAERSTVMRTILRGREGSTPAQPKTWKEKARYFFRSLFIHWPATESAPAPDTDISKSRQKAAADLRDQIKAARDAPDTNLGSWTPEVLRFTESVAEVFVEEVAEWSVLYNKELLEP